jgi:hypothetical protein
VNRPSAALTLASILAAAACSSSNHPAPPSSSTPPTANVTAPGQLTEDSICADYLAAPPDEQVRFLTAEVIAHIPQNRPSITIPAFPGGTPSIGNGNTYANTGVVVFLQGAMTSTCTQDPSGRLGDLLAPAWSSSPSP